MLVTRTHHGPAQIVRERSAYIDHLNLVNQNCLETYQHLDVSFELLVFSNSSASCYPWPNLKLPGTNYPT